MSETFTIKALVGEPKQWDSKYGPMTTFVIEAESPLRRGEFDLNRKGTLSDAKQPTVGETVDADVVPGKDGLRPKLKAVQAAKGSGGGGRSPQERAEIVRQHSQDMALRAIELMSARNLIPEDGPKTTELVQKYADWFDADVKRAGERANG